MPCGTSIFTVYHIIANNTSINFDNLYAFNKKTLICNKTTRSHLWRGYSIYTITLIPLIFRNLPWLNPQYWFIWTLSIYLWETMIAPQKNLLNDNQQISVGIARRRHHKL